MRISDWSSDVCSSDLHRHRRRPHRRRRPARRHPRADEQRIGDQGTGNMIPELNIGQGGAVRAEAPWADSDARRPSKNLKLVLSGLALAAAAILFAASNDRLSRFLDGGLAGWTADPAETAQAVKRKATARLQTRQAAGRER